MSKALIVIDVQNDYFENGAFALWNTDETLKATISAIERARAAQIPVVFVQHVADPEAGISPFFNPGTPGVELHPAVRAAAPDAPVVQKQFADAFEQTTLQATLDGLDTPPGTLVLCGMMTQNCVTHTALSKAADAYDVHVLVDCTTTVDAMIHNIALHALSTRVALSPAVDAL